MGHTGCQPPTLAKVLKFNPKSKQQNSRLDRSIGSDDYDYFRRSSPSKL